MVRGVADGGVAAGVVDGDVALPATIRDIFMPKSQCPATSQMKKYSPALVSLTTGLATVYMATVLVEVHAAKSVALTS